ncbi:hypothetical protein ME763_16525 [Streptomyces murinus]|uniref:hypothetical protein n=1 Tax=Streptomyces murinus TaxID=33900 RepID=UPI000A1E9665|nr:hypothetical protein [Streptomyces murinus]WDO07143.1 hypothetical protein ME763_16525 [Streptomyces murinus]
MTATEPDAEELCARGRAAYERALRAGRTAAADTRSPEPVAAAVARQGPLRASTERIAAVRRRETRIARSMEPLLRATRGLPGRTPVVLDTSS